MTTISVTLDAHNEYLDDGTVITWPDASLTLVTPGDYILKNRGYAGTAYSRLDGTTFTITGGVNYTTTPPTVSSTPYINVDPTNFDLNDEENQDLEHFATVSYVPNADGIYPITVHAASDATIWHETQIAPSIVGLNHLTPASVHRGHFVGGTLKIDVQNALNGTVTDYSLDFGSSDDSKTVLFVTDDGAGDSNNPINVGIGGGGDGAYLITPTSMQIADGSGLLGYASPPLIGNNAGNSSHYASDWPDDGALPYAPAQSMIAFCTLFPGSSSLATLASTGGGLGSVVTYNFRYCYYKSLTILKTSAGSIGTPPPRTIETPLSTNLSVTPNTGTNTNTITFTVPPVPAGWDGIRIYASLGAFASTTYWPLTVSVTNAQISGGNTLTTYGSVAATRSGLTFTYTLCTPVGTSAIPIASYGFSAWATGTLLAKDPVAQQYALMKVAHIAPQADSTTGKYQVNGYNGAMNQTARADIPIKGVAAPHINSMTNLSTAAASGKVLVADGSGGASWGSGVQHGFVDFGTTSVAGNSSTGGTVSFSPSFAGAPHVTATPVTPDGNNGATPLCIGVAAVSTTGFAWTVWNVTGSSAPFRGIMWHAAYG